MYNIHGHWGSVQDGTIGTVAGGGCITDLFGGLCAFW